MFSLEPPADRASDYGLYISSVTKQITYSDKYELTDGQAIVLF
jgi:hypothetical protein